MSVKAGDRFCNQCQKQVLTQKNTPSHILHLLLSVITVGLWVVVWILISVASGTHRCSECGQRI